tara:strand:- start:989 stop:2557 length:1569 start_codon:yes stop_codon:yes gene_type:complete
LKFKVFIPTAGVGARLENITKFINKSLIEVNNIPIITHIIEKFNKKQEFVIAVGYKSKLVKDYIKIAHPNLKVQFIEVKKYLGQGSGLGLTMLHSKKFLQCPFIFFSCDSFVKNVNIPKPNHNWMGYSKECNPKLYRTILHKKGTIKNILEKNSKIKQLKNYIGICGIKNYKEFWSAMDFNKETINTGEVQGLKKILKKKTIFSKEFNWFDCGNLKSLEKIRNIYKNTGINILPKDHESIFFVKNKVIKFSKSKNFIKKRIERQKILKKFTPKITDFKENFYAYKKVKGKIFSEISSIKNFKILMKFLKNFWKLKKINNINEKKNFFNDCEMFYKKKTLQRIDEFYKKHQIKDNSTIINKNETPPLKEILKKIDWKIISNGIPGNFHGDLHFENILINKKKRFTLLDWRQDFGENIFYGDIYYDLAKLMHGMIISHNIIKKNGFNILQQNKKKKITYSFYQHKINKIILKDYEKWIIFNGFNLKKVRILTSLIFLNIAPLHHCPYSIFLYYLGKDLLYKEIK